MLEVDNIGIVSCMPQRPEIGSRYNRSHAIERDSHTGLYWERMPTFGHYEELLQRGLLNNRKAIITSVTEIEVMEFLHG